MNRILAAATGLLLLTTTAACGSDDGGSTNEQRTLTVFAAASLTDTFTEIGQEFESANPGVTVRFSFDGSSNLVAQLQQGAPADVFASADTTTMATATDDGLVDGSPTDFATNVLQIVTPPDNPAGVESLADLADPDVAVVLCAPQVPCGNASVEVERLAGIDIAPVSEEQSVTDVLNKVATGEADAGLVYVTDAAGAGDAVRGIEIPDADRVVNTYPIAAIDGSAHVDLARSFVEFVTGEAGQSILGSAGFGAPR